MDYWQSINSWFWNYKNCSQYSKTVKKRNNFKILTFNKNYFQVRIISKGWFEHDESENWDPKVQGFFENAPEPSL